MMGNFPLPIPHRDRTNPVDFIPHTSDPTNRGEIMWRVLSQLKITQGPLAGKRLGEVAPPWQERWVRTLYGAVDRATGQPRYDEAFLLIAKKNGKSSLIGMLAIAHCIAFPEERGLVVVLAKVKEQAHLCYDSMAATIEADSYLMKQFQVRRYKSDILHNATGTVLKALSTEMSSTTGLAPHFYIVDELHLIGEKPTGAAMVRQLSSGASVRSQSLGVYITTAPVGVSKGIYKSMVDRCARILSGEAQSDRLMPTSFTLPGDVNPDDSSYWWMANPSMGYTFTEDWLHREFDIAKSDPDSSNIANFYSQHLNIPSAEVMGTDRWIPLKVWDRNIDESITLESLITRSSSIWCGVDAGVRDDPTAIVVLGLESDDRFLVWSHQWLHADGFNKRKDHAPYELFRDAGELTVCDREGQDTFELVSMIVEKLLPTEKLAAVGVDIYKLAGLIQALEAKDIDVLAVPQGWQMGKFIIQTDRMIHEGKIRHFGGPMLRFNVENGQVQERGRGLALTKPGEVSVSKLKIDGLVCLIMAIAANMEKPHVPFDIGAFIV
jgi:phage terminase large subunit-like protein